MSKAKALPAAARAELDRTLDSLTWRALEETAVTAATVAVVTLRTVRDATKHLTRKD